MENLNEIMTLLNKPLWSLQDIQKYFSCGQCKASKIMQQAKLISVSRFLPSKAKRDNVFKVLGLDVKTELQYMQMAVEANDRKNESY